MIMYPMLQLLVLKIEMQDLSDLLEERGEVVKFISVQVKVLLHT